VRGDLCSDCPAVSDGPAAGGVAADSPLAVLSTPPGQQDARPACERAVLVRVHTRCTAGDIFAADCRCRETLDQSLRMIAAEGCGVLLYLHNTSRGFAIEQTPESEVSPVSESRPGAPAELSGGGGARLALHEELRAREGSQARSGRILRAIGLGGQILTDLGIQRIRLLSNTPMHIPALEGFGLEIVEQVAIPLDAKTI
jgi:3,4-dihydroxy 2-butanone 4-phosphate synthase/GTP cyclohydrolase II